MAYFLVFFGPEKCGEINASDFIGCSQKREHKIAVKNVAKPNTAMDSVDPDLAIKIRLSMLAKAVAI